MLCFNDLVLWIICYGQNISRGKRFVPYICNYLNIETSHHMIHILKDITIGSSATFFVGRREFYRRKIATPPVYTVLCSRNILYCLQVTPLTAFLVSTAKRNKARKAELVVFTFQFHFFLSLEEETSLAISINTRKDTTFSFGRDFMDTFNMQSHHRYI